MDVTAMDSFAIIQLAMSLFGALGFALFFNVSTRHIPIASLGGILTWLVYWALFKATGSIFVPCLVASTFAALYSEVISHELHVPTTVFFIISVIPLVPGRGLFYTMSDAVRGNWASCAQNGTDTLLFAAGIAAGICIIAAGVQTLKYARGCLSRKK